MKKNISFWMLGIAAMLASCSNEDVLQGASDNDGTATFTVVLDEGMKTRAYTDDDPVTRCLPFVLDESGNLVQAIDANTVTQGTDAENHTTFTFTVTELDKDAKYQIVCWADGDEGYTVNATEGTAPTVSIPTDVSNGLPIAYYGKTTTAATLEELENGIELRHAVTKVSLVTTTAVNIDGTSTKDIQISVPSYDTFSLSTGYAEGTAGTQTCTSNATFNANATVFYIYVFGTQAVSAEGATIAYGENSTSVTNLPINPNKHIILKGDVATIGVKPEYTFTATVDNTWDGDEEILFPHVEEGRIVTYAAGFLSVEDINTAIGTDNRLTIEGSMNDSDLAKIKSWLDNNKDKTLELDLADTDLTELPSYCFSGCSNLVGITLPQNLTSLASFSFARTGLTTVDIPASVTEIGETFSRCSSLSEIHIRGQITNVYAFCIGCSALTGIYFYNTTTPPTVSTNLIFQDVNTNNLKVHLPESAKAEDWYNSTTHWKLLSESNYVTDL